MPLEALSLGAEDGCPTDSAELNASKTAAKHDAVSGELGDPQLAGKLTVISEGEIFCTVDVSDGGLTAGSTSRTEDTDACKDEAGEHGNASAAEADEEAHGERTADKGRSEANGVDQVHGEVELVNSGPACAIFSNTISITTKVVSALSF